MENSLAHKYSIVIVDDEFFLNKLIQIELMKNEYNTVAITSGHDFMEWIGVNKYDHHFFLFDYFLKDMTAKEIIEELKLNNIVIPYMIMTGQGDEKIAVDMMKLGAFDYAVKEVGFVSILPAKLEHAIRQFEMKIELENTREVILKNEKKYRSIFENIQDIYFELNQKGEMLEISPSVKSLLLYDRNELIGTNMKDLLLTEDNDKFITNIFNHKNKYDCEIKLKQSDGSIRYYSLTGQLMEFNSSKDQIFSGSLHDISERIENEKNSLNIIIETEEKERKHFAELLHDGLGPLLSTLKIYLNLLVTGKHNTTKKKEISDTAFELLDETVRITREITYKLIPDVLSDYGLIKALDSFCKKIKLSEKFSIEIKSNLDERIDHKVEVVLYRTLVELINNSMKHSTADKIKITIFKEGNVLKISYKDNGQGFDFNKTIESDKIEGIGLKYLMNRIKVINGKFSFEAKDGSHFKIEILLKDKG